MNSKDYIHLEEKYGTKYYNPLDVVLTRGEGVWVYDVDDNRYLDFLSGYSSLNQGHCHPKIVGVLTEQAQRLPMTSRAFRNDQIGLFYEKIHEVTGYETVLPMNTGSEAIESALKVARKWAYVVKNVPDNKAEIITCQGNFHGRTITIISFSSEQDYKENFGPFTPGFVSIPYGNIQALEEAITPNTAAFLVEAIQAEGGIIMPPDGYLKEVRDLCTQNNILFIADEIQTGLGRTGKLFACDHENVRPDMVVIGKALAGGLYPVSAVLSSREILGDKVLPPGSHGSTFGGNPLACAVAREALQVLVEEDMIENSAQTGRYFLEKLQQINSPHVKEVRGQGLLIGIELNTQARRFCEALQRQGILCKETHDYVIRISPPLLIDRDTVDWALERIEQVLTDET